MKNENLHLIAFQHGRQEMNSFLTCYYSQIYATFSLDFFVNGSTQLKMILIPSGKCPFNEQSCAATLFLFDRTEFLLYEIISHVRSVVFRCRSLIGRTLSTLVR